MSVLQRALDKLSPSRRALLRVFRENPAENTIPRLANDLGLSQCRVNQLLNGMSSQRMGRPASVMRAPYPSSTIYWMRTQRGDALVGLSLREEKA